MGKLEEPQIKVHWTISFLTFFSYSIIYSVGRARDFIADLTGISRYRDKTRKSGYGQLLVSWESFYTRRLYHRIQDCWNRPLSTAPGSHIDIMERVSNDGNCTLSTTGKVRPCINLGSYNYLGFADDWKQTCKATVINSTYSWPLSISSSRNDIGTTVLHEELEQNIAKFVGKEAAIVLAMGYDTNTSMIPALMGPNALIISDSLNHTSLVNGARASLSTIKVFEHNNPVNLEAVLRESILIGQYPKYSRPWSKILVMVEGIYSMEGDVCQLKEIVRIVKKYKAYIYVDEAHSIGALGATGRGICEHTGVDPREVDILMGTFTKSFSAMGGYIAASQDIINTMKLYSPGVLYHNTISPIICQQILTALRVITGEDGTAKGSEKILKLHENSKWFRSEMERIGLHVYGDDDSPIVPVLIYLVAKLPAFSRECLQRGLAVVVVGFPACSPLLGRARFCLSAGHSKEDLEYAVKNIEEIADLLNIRYARRTLG